MSAPELFSLSQRPITSLKDFPPTFSHQIQKVLLSGYLEAGNHFPGRRHVCQWFLNPLLHHSNPTPAFTKALFSGDFMVFRFYSFFFFWLFDAPVLSISLAPAIFSDMSGLVPESYRALVSSLFRSWISTHLAYRHAEYFTKFCLGCGTGLRMPVSMVQMVQNACATDVCWHIFQEPLPAATPKL